MPKPNRNDISIGENQWIAFVELEDTPAPEIELDDILKPVEPFFDSLETECVAACCGISAYALWPNDIADAVRQSKIPDLEQAFDSIRKRIAETDGDEFVSRRMNNYFHRTTLLQLIDHVAYWVAHSAAVGKQSQESV